jgi:hypothetical protein
VSQNELRGTTQLPLETLIPRLKRASLGFIPVVILFTIRKALPYYLPPEAIAELNRPLTLRNMFTGLHLLDLACLVALWFGPQFGLALYFMNEPRAASAVYGLMIVEVVLIGLGLMVLFP